MQEYVTDAIVLAKYPSGEYDARYVLFTKKFGKVIARAKSSRKITSKLGGHLEPGTVIKVRFIEKVGTQIVDALKTGDCEIAYGDLGLLASLISEMEPDVGLWEIFLSPNSFSWSRILALLGWDPTQASCAQCGRQSADFFVISRQEFWCSSCVSKSGYNKVSFIKV